MANGFSSSAVAELALFQEMHSTSETPCGHNTLLVPFAVVKGTGAHLFPVRSVDDLHTYVLFDGSRCARCIVHFHA